MAIYDGVSGKRRGSVGNETYAITRGQNIVREKINQTTNPRTTSQQTQRATFAQAIRFYQTATRNFFKFAFESQKSKESDYNAFMRLNAKKSLIVPKYNAEDNPDYPLVGQWMMSQGSLEIAPIVEFTGQTGDFVFEARLHKAGDYSERTAPTTGAELSALLVAEFGLQYGDIITMPWWYALGQFSAGSIMLSGSQRNMFAYKQFILSTSDTRSLSDLGGMNVGVVLSSTECNVRFFIPFKSPQIMLSELVAGGTMILSRLVGEKLLVSNSFMAPSTGAESLTTLLNDPAVRESLLREWGATGTAILKGGQG